jgi:DNA polymerase-3 subunit alpha
LAEFHSLTQFIHKTDGRKVNKKVIESLIKVGAMDRFGTRSSMLENLEEIRQTAAQFQSDVDGQDNLFTKVSVTSTEIQDSFLKLKEYPTKELLSFEKELLGMYLTDNPLAEQLEAVNRSSNKNIADLDLNIHQEKVFTFGGILSRVKITKTKKNGAEMAFGTLQDTTGSIEIVFFPKLFQQEKELIQENKVVLIKAAVQLREDELKLIAEKISVPENMPAQTPQTNAKEIFIPRKTEKTTLQKLGTFLKEHPGKTAVAVLIPNGAKPERLLLPYKVAWSDNLEKEIQTILG